MRRETDSVFVPPAPPARLGVTLLAAAAIVAVGVGAGLGARMVRRQAARKTLAAKARAAEATQTYYGLRQSEALSDGRSEVRARLAAEYGDPDPDEPQTDRARAYLALAGGPGDPIALAAKLPDEAEAAYVRGRALALAGDPGAVAALEKSISIRPTPLARVALASALEQAGRLDDALKALEPAGEFPAAVIERALVLARQHKPLPGLDIPDLSRAQQIRALVARGRVLDAVALGPTADPRVDDLLVEALVDAGQIAEARAIVERAPTPIRIARVALEENQPEVALASLAARTDPEALILRAEARRRLGDLFAARGDVDGALAVWPDRTDAQILRARIDLDLGLATKAIERLEPMAGDHVAAFLLAVAHRRAGEPQKALEMLIGQARAGAPPDVALELARAHRDLGQIDEAEAEYARAGTDVAKLEAALVRFDAGDYAGARAAIDALPSEPDVLVACGEVHVAVGDLDGAERCLGAIPPGAVSPDARRARARLLLARGDARGAAALLGDELLKVDALLAAGDTSAADLVAHHLGDEDRDLARAHMNLPTNAGAAIALLQDAIPKLHGRKLAAALADLGRAQALAKDLTAAEATLRRAAEQDPSSGEIAYQLGLVLEARGELRPAADELARATNANPALADAWFELGVASQKLKLTSARAAFQRYLALAPTGKHAADARRLAK